MVFMKTAQKFGQWSDPKAGTMYGVGFPNEDDLNKVEQMILVRIFISFDFLLIVRHKQGCTKWECIYWTSLSIDFIALIVSEFAFQVCLQCNIKAGQ